MMPQFGTVLVDLVARFARLEWGELRVCKISPGNAQQFLSP
jgi:hypothetical protein